jgi:hypothetical protein
MLFGGDRSHDLSNAQYGIRDDVDTSPACESSTDRT